MITKHRLLIFLGILIVLLQFAGFPSKYEDFFNVILGALVTLLAFLIAKHNHPKMTEHEEVTEVYSQKKALYPEFSLEEEESNDHFTDIEAIRRESEKNRS